MNMPLERLEAEALQLPPDERAHLARRLIARLDEGSPEDPAEVEREWEAEIERRLEAYRRGGSQDRSRVASHRGPQEPCGALTFG
jgi:putative addiction module component (TIGR02574 family)